MDASIKRRLETELERFRKLAGVQRTVGYVQVVPLDEWTVELRPSRDTGTLHGGKSIGLTILALVHGNEVGGAASLNEVLDFFVTSGKGITFPIVFGLGNPWAAREGVRFLERDLNRSFANQAVSSLEERRARALEPYLAKSAFLLDVHQTTEVADRPFFIFPYEARGFAFANAVAPYASTVTHWGDPFSAEGQCTDEFVNSKGGTGITLELGQSGFDPYQVAFGVQCMFAAIRQVEAVHCDAAQLKVPMAGLYGGQIYTWAGVVPYPKGDTDLIPGWFNFKKVEQGDLLGHCDGVEIRSPATGRVLFPKYRRPQDVKRPPTELCRIMKEIQLSDLPY